MKNNFAHRIISSLNESISTATVPEVENEKESGVNAPVQVHQCDDCASFYLVSDKANESVCCECGGTGHPYADINKIGENIEPENTDKISDIHPLTEEEEAEIKSEAEVVVNEALRTLDRSDYKKFNECYAPRCRITNKGELEVLVESNGHTVTAKRRMTSRQKASYNLSESYKKSVIDSSARAKKNESIRTHRMTLRMMNEARSIRVHAAKVLERQGAKYDYAKFNESMNKFIAGKNYRKLMEDIASDDEIGKSELDNMTPDEVADQVVKVIKDTGLDVLSNDVKIDGDTATVTLRVEDSDDLEVRTSEIEDVLEDAFDAPVEIVGPTLTEGDDNIADLAVIINPEDEENGELNEGDDETCPECGKDPCECNECDDTIKSEKQMNEKFVSDPIGNLFALVAIDSSDNEPQFLAQDDSLVSGNEDGAEDRARIFISAEAAQAYLQNAGIEDKYQPVSISIIKNESLEDPDGEVVEENDESGEFTTDKGTYFKKDGYFYIKDNDGKVREIAESEYDEAKASKKDEEDLTESIRRGMIRRK